MGQQAPSLSATLERRGPFGADAVSYADARATWTAFRREHGYKGDAAMLTPPESQAKLGKGDVALYSLTLAPASTSGAWNVCQWSTPQCEAACVLTARYRSVHEARIVRTAFIAEHTAAAVALIVGELRAAVAKHGRIGFRPNAASDLRWERIAPDVLRVDGVDVYDYTKAPARQRDALEGAYRLVYSVSERERSTREALDYLRSGGNAAVVFDTRKGEALPATWHGFQVVDGDVTDARFTDPHGTVVGLRAKGKARGRTGTEDGFVKPGIAS